MQELIGPALEILNDIISILFRCGKGGDEISEICSQQILAIEERQRRAEEDENEELRRALTGEPDDDEPDTAETEVKLP